MLLASIHIIPSGHATIVNTSIGKDLDSGCYCKRELIYLTIYFMLFNNACSCALSIVVPLTLTTFGNASGGRSHPIASLLRKLHEALANATSFRNSK